MMSFKRYISEVAATGRVVPGSYDAANKARLAARASKKKKGDSRNLEGSSDPVFYRARRAKKVDDRLLDFQSPAFLQTYNTAGGDAAQTRWRVTQGRQPGHLAYGEKG